MDPRHDHQPELVVIIVTVVGLSRLLDGPLLWLAAALVLVAAWLGARQVLAEGSLQFARIQPDAPIVPAVAAVAALGALRLVPLGLALVPALAAAGLLLNVALRMERRLVVRPTGMTAGDRTALLGVALLVGFLAFTGVAALVAGGLVEPATDAALVGPQISESGIVAIALGDAAVAGLLGFRLASVRLAGARDALWAAGTYAASIAVAAGLLRAVALPRLAFPALLTLVFYLWDAIRASAPSLRRDPRFIWQTVLLAVLGVAVIAWNLGLRGS
jgi:hypothetical protein